MDRAIHRFLAAEFVLSDVHSGNEELQALIRSQEKRLSCVATINPKYVGWQRDFVGSD